mmetsp:Transcript_14211/g.32226  ORF Transcript_14211/g.32226 Transcript_14211/m.32226 type:complete len:82 (+) Transcript_14211:320-565(+)
MTGLRAWTIEFVEASPTVYVPSSNNSSGVYSQQQPSRAGGRIFQLGSPNHLLHRMVFYALIESEDLLPSGYIVDANRSLCT